MELWDVYNCDREKTGETAVRGEALRSGWYHLVVHACVFNSRGEMLIQQRQPFKHGWSNMWGVSVGGSAVSGETSQAAVERELYEELGLRLSFRGIRPHMTVNFRGGFDDIYLIENDVDIDRLKLQYEEVQRVQWASADEIIKMIDDGNFISYHKSLIQLFFDMRKGYGNHNRKDTSSPVETLETTKSE